MLTLVYINPNLFIQIRKPEAIPTKENSGAFDDTKISA